MTQERRAELRVEFEEIAKWKHPLEPIRADDVLGLLDDHEAAAQRIEELERENAELRASLQWKEIEKEKPPRHKGDRFYSESVQVRAPLEDDFVYHASYWDYDKCEWMGAVKINWPEWRRFPERIIQEEMKEGEGGN